MSQYRAHLVLPVVPPSADVPVSRTVGLRGGIVVGVVRGERHAVGREVVCLTLLAQRVAGRAAEPAHGQRVVLAGRRGVNKLFHEY